MADIAATTARARRKHVGKLNWAELGPFLALAILLIVGFLVNPDFLSANNITNVVTRSAFVIVIGVGATFVISSGGLDLSVGSMAAFVTGVMILFMNAVVHDIGSNAIAAGMVLALVVGAFCGLGNGLIVTVGGIEPFIATLGTMGIFRALITYLSDGGTIPIDHSLRDVYRPVYFGAVLGIP